MKRTDLAKNLGLKINGQLRQTATPGRFGKDSVVADRREQRKLDQAAGLLPFAVKLDKELIAELQAQAAQHEQGMNELVAELLRKGLAG
ncbi:hypothetical protein ABWL39_14570 [Chitinivorax sp. PXF-14]|uniref:hypothetical protein n=1 Tax=Chitinivorax sp. PXF-14 TaxID=3230488 RepID=UPI003467E2A2